MNVGTISLVGISVVFFTFIVLFFLFKLLARLFGEKKTTVTKRTFSTKSIKKRKEQTEIQQLDLELAAVITAAIETYTTNEFKIISINEKITQKEKQWRTQKPKIWRPTRKGVKRTW